jgi:hypothetical protein
MSEWLHVYARLEFDTPPDKWPELPDIAEADGILEYSRLESQPNIAFLHGNLCGMADPAPLLAWFAEVVTFNYCTINAEISVEDTCVPQYGFTCTFKRGV